MKKEAQLRVLFERILPSVMGSLENRPLPISAHQVAADLYNAVDRYMEAVSHNQHSSARQAAEELLCETLRALSAYESPLPPAGIDSVRIEHKEVSSKTRS